MGRSVRSGLDYFPLEVGFFDDHKLLMIEEDHGIRGGYLAIRLIGMIYKEGYFLKWEEASPFSTAKRVGNSYTGNEVESIVKSCLKYDLFDIEKFNEFSILTSNGIQKRWLHIMNAIRRKVEINVAYVCISSEDIPDKPHLSTDNLQESTQKKGKERKGKESSSPADKPQVPKKSKKVSTKKNTEPEPYWDLIIEIWFSFNEEKYGGRPILSGQDARNLKKLIQLLKARAKLKQVEWNEQTAPQRLRAYLDEAFEDPWLKGNFLLNNLVTQFNKIILNHSQHATNRKNTGGTIIPITGGKSAGAIELVAKLKDNLTASEHAGG